MSGAADPVVGAASPGDVDAVVALINRAFAVERFFAPAPMVEAP